MWDLDTWKQKKGSRSWRTNAREVYYKYSTRKTKAMPMSMIKSLVNREESLLATIKRSEYVVVWPRHQAAFARPSCKALLKTQVSRGDNTKSGQTSKNDNAGYDNTGSSENHCQQIIMEEVVSFVLTTYNDWIHLGTEDNNYLYHPANRENIIKKMTWELATPWTDGLGGTFSYKGGCRFERAAYSNTGIH